MNTIAVNVSPAIELGIFCPTVLDRYVDLRLKLEPDDSSYDYSKLYYSTSPSAPYSENEVICFRVRFQKTVEKIRLVIPVQGRQSGYLRLRLDGLPYSAGSSVVESVQLAESDNEHELSRGARLFAQKEWVRKEVVRSENERRANLPHFPESLSMELTSRCNLTCSHCGSHGVANLHQINNQRSEFDIDLLAHLAHEVFPHLTLVTLVGRGEPTMVSDKLWWKLIELLDYYKVFLSCVTNGYFVKERITEAVLPLIDTLTFSIDGITKDTFAANRGGASLDHVLAGIRYYHELRQKVPLMRRPKLGVSWTIKRNNITEFPDFIRFIRQFEPDFLYVRHLLIFHQRDQFQSLLDSPKIANRYLKEAYDLLNGCHIKLEVPPLTEGDCSHD